MSRAQPIADVLSELMTRRGYARVQGNEAVALAWREAAGDLMAGLTRACLVRRGALEVVVANSALVQELTYRKATILTDLARLLPTEKIKNLKFRVGPIE